MSRPKSRVAIWEGGNMAFKLVISDPKTRKSYQKEVSGEGILRKKIGEKFPGNVAGLDGYELQITGGTDKDGFPMRKDVKGAARKKILLSSGTGFRAKLGGERKRKSIRGNTISEDIAQINTKIVKWGKQPLEKIFGAKEENKEAAEASDGSSDKNESSEKPEEKKE